MFYDNVNDKLPAWYKDIGATVKSSNLCTEILEPSTEDESFVCDLSSLNLVEYEKWKHTDLVQTMIIFLDTVMEEYIEKTANLKFMEAPHRFARRHRSLGLGVLGWHSVLQSKMLPFGSKEAYRLNEEIHAHIQSESIKASRYLAATFGEPEVLQGYGMRNTMLNAIAPTKSSSFILGSGQISQAVEPIDSNYYIENLAKTKITIRNQYLERALEDIGQNTPDIWMNILMNGGSVQTLDIDPHLKDVFKTYVEIDQKDIILQAAQRQKYIDQSQSLNLMYHPKTDPTEASRHLLLAEATGVKTLYYHHGKNLNQELAREKVAEASCTACEA
jgi:ribonucleoside-diphosphate reductase alpha chain